jgi:hypothetical protein
LENHFLIVVGGAEYLKGFHRMEDGQIFLKTCAPLSLISAFRTNLISARSILLASTFKDNFQTEEGRFFLPPSTYKVNIEIWAQEQVKKKRRPSFLAVVEIS